MQFLQVHCWLIDLGGMTFDLPCPSYIVLITQNDIVNVSRISTNLFNKICKVLQGICCSRCHPFVSLFTLFLSDTSTKTTTLIVIFIKEKQET